MKFSVAASIVVMRALGNRLRKGTHVVWLDQVLPMYRKDQFDLVGVIGMVKSTNHRFRVCSIFRAGGGGAEPVREDADGTTREWYNVGFSDAVRKDSNVK